MNKFEYKNLTPFKWFVLENFPFIEADFDALTEWQLFCKIGKEINKIIDSQNIVGEQAETLTNAFNNLKNYVDNYFNNLDVQDEINNKLNEMAEEGYFTNILNNITNSYFSKLQVSENSNFLSVGKIGCTFTTINEAINYAKNYANINNRVGIVIFPGTYNEEITLLDSHGIDLFGIGNVIVSHSSTYPNAPIYITGDAKISNIHFLNSGEGTYSMHYEISQSGVTGKVEFFNCIFEVTNGVNTSSVGIGLGSNNTLRFNNCKFINNSNRAPFFLHTSPYENSSNVNVYVEYCEFIGQNQLNTAVIIDNGGYDKGFTNGENLFHFIGNTSQNSKLVIYRRTQNERIFRLYSL